MNQQLESEADGAVRVRDGASVIAGIVGCGFLELQRPLLLFGRAQVALDGFAIFGPRDLGFRITFTGPADTKQRKEQKRSSYLPSPTKQNRLVAAFQSGTIFWQRVARDWRAIFLPSAGHL